MGAGLQNSSCPWPFRNNALQAVLATVSDAHLLGQLVSRRGLGHSAIFCKKYTVGRLQSNQNACCHPSIVSSGQARREYKFASLMNAYRSLDDVLHSMFTELACIFSGVLLRYFAAG